jgi:DNA-binding transcriptional LysR family regulator
MAATIAPTSLTNIDLNLVSAFVRVMETGSFTAAAKELGLPKSSVSRRVSGLESALRVQLLQRSTRKLVLTEAGRVYFDRVRAALGTLADASAAVTHLSAERAGLIRFTAGSDNTGLLAGLLAEFLARYPKIQIEAVLTPRRVDLVGEGFDLALRAGPLIDSALIARRLGRLELGLFASRAYLRKAGRPRSLAELAKHRFVLLGASPNRGLLHLTGPDGETSVKIQGPLIADDLPFLADAVTFGVGIGLIPDVYFGWMHRGGLRTKRRDLVRLLPDYGVVGSELSLVSPPTAYEPARVGLLRDFLADKLRSMMQACALATAADKVEAGKREGGPKRKTAGTATAPPSAPPLK